MFESDKKKKIAASEDALDDIISPSK